MRITRSRICTCISVTNIAKLHTVPANSECPTTLDCISEHNKKVSFLDSQLFTAHLPSYQGSDLAISEVWRPLSPSPIYTPVLTSASLSSIPT